MVQKYMEFEKQLAAYLRPRAVTALRYAMGFIYLWYGMLKVAGISPVEELVYHATHWIGTHHFVTFLGVWEVAIGLFLMIKKYQRIGLLLLFLQFPGTFLPLFLNPEDCFTMIPFGLTLEGQYIFKNLVLIAGGLILIAALHPSESSKKR